MARRLVHAYPAPWRGRYEDEVLALLDDDAVRWRDVVDLSRRLVVERTRAMLEPGDRPVLTLWGCILGQAGLGIALSCGAIAAGMAGAAWLGPIPSAVGKLAQLAFLTCWVFWVFPSLNRIRRPFTIAAIRHPLTPVREKAPVSSGLVWLSVTTFLVAVVLSVWADLGISPPLEALWWIYMPVPGFLVGPLLLSREPWDRIQAATRQLFTTRHDLKWALLELERCERLAADGMSSPLEEARTSVHRVILSRDAALATLHAAGYRAKFTKGELPGERSILGEP